MVGGLKSAICVEFRRTFLIFIFVAISLASQFYFGHKYLYIYIYKKVSDKYDTLVSSQCRERSENHFEIMKNISRGKNIFVARGLHNGSRIIAGPPRGLPERFYGRLVLNYCCLALIIFRVEIMKV